MEFNANVSRDPDEGNILDDIIEVQVDAELRNILSAITAHQKVSDGSLSLSEAKEIAAQSDRILISEGFMRESGLLCGNSFFVDTSDGDAKYVPSTVIDKHVEFQGFFAIPKDEKDWGVNYDGEYEIMLQFQGYDSNIGTKGQTQFLMRIPDLLSLKFDYAMSSQHAEKVLAVYVPDLMLSIDQLIDLSENEVDIINRFAGVVWEIQQENRVEIARALNVYLNSKVNFDPLPYILEPLNEVHAWVHDRDEGGTSLKPVILNTDTQVALQDCNLRLLTPCSPDNDVDHIVIAHLEADVYDDSHFAEPRRYCIPVHKIDSMKSLRRSIRNSSQRRSLS